VNPRLRHKNYVAEFGGPCYRVASACEERDSLALDAVQQFIEERGQVPTEYSWTAAGITPSERTVRRRFGSFAAAVQAARSTKGDERK
jgi:hypothetical protein